MFELKGLLDESLEAARSVEVEVEFVENDQNVLNEASVSLNELAREVVQQILGQPSARISEMEEILNWAQEKTLSEDLVQFLEARLEERKAHDNAKRKEIREKQKAEKRQCDRVMEKEFGIPPKRRKKLLVLDHGQAKR